MTATAVCASAVFATAQPSRLKYPVFGVDVSNYQGVIDWERIEEQGVKFAFIKATEGSGHTDESVRRNLSDIADTSIRKSCYHFFSFDSSGETQAENFINSVGIDEIDMPPVVDIEYYGDKASDKPSREEAEKILTPLLELLEEHYGVKPIIYTTLPVYYRYVSENYSDYPLWIRCTQFAPDILDWKFWQYSDCGKLEGYYGEEECIDYNVFCGTLEEFEEFYDI
ncbi:MAG: glycosyl hydrolase family 25 [Ruminococcus sp.]|nr:glycosyl hydrolase family 25 [Ruminococcus sp.]